MSRAPYGQSMQTLNDLIKIDTDACVIWPHGLTRGGYGQVRVPPALRLSSTNPNRKVHALACELAYGPRPDGMEVAHSCGVPACVNSRHLRWATHTSNMADTIRHNRSLRGTRHPGSKLTDADVVAIRQRLQSGDSKAKIAEDHGISRGYIWFIGSGRRWSWLPEAS